MRVTDLWQPGAKPTVSFELFPARTEKAAAGLETAIDELAGLNPNFVSVTFGAGGSTRDGSYQLVKKLIQEKGLEVVAYFACFGLSPAYIDEVLTAYRDLGVQTILAVRGDAPKEAEGFEPAPDALAHASDLVAYIRSKFDFCVGAAGYPEGHIEAPSKDQDLEHLARKVNNGAEYIIANYFYDNQYFFDFMDRCRAAGITAPILPGVMPIYSVKMMEMLASLCGATITEEIRSGLAALDEGDAAAVGEFGVRFAVKQIKGLIEHGAPGVHIYTMDRFKASKAIVTALKEQGLV